MIKMDCGCEFETNDQGKILLDFDNINFKCEKTIQLLQSGYTKGVFQLESQLGRTWCKKVKPENIEQVSDVIAIIRPGTLKSYEDGKSLTQHYVDRKFGKEDIKSCHPVLDKILKNTYSVLTYQEQSMQIAKDLAGFNLKEADELRKGIGKKDSQLIASLKGKFLDGCKKIGTLNQEQAEQVFGWIQSSQRYAFNKCISGKEILFKNKGKYNTKLSIEEMYYIKNDIHYAKKTNHLNLYKKYKLHKNYCGGYSLNQDNKIRPNTILNITQAGIQDIYRVTVDNNLTIDVTLLHKFPTPNGEKPLYKLQIGDELYINNGYDKKQTKKYGYSDIDIPTLRQKQKNHDHVQIGFMIGKNNPGYTNGEWIKWNINRKLLKLECYHCGKTNTRLETHHIDNNRQNNDLSNLENLCVSCHKKAHYKLDRVRKGQKGYLVRTGKITDIKFLEKGMTYNVEMEAPNHNFVIDNGIVTSNSHSIAYACSSYISAYCKQHFPLQFFVSYLKFADDKQDPLLERKTLVDDAHNFNINIKTPSLLNTNDNIHISGKNTVSFGIANIKGTGLSTLDKLKDGIKNTQIDIHKLIKDWTWTDYLFFFSDRIPLQTNIGLISSGACDFFLEQRQFMIFQYEIWNKLTNREKAFVKENKPESLVTGLSLLLNGFKIIEKRKQVVSSLITSLEYPPVSLKDTPDWIAWQEEKLLGISLTCHKVDGCGGNIEATHTCHEVHSSTPRYAVVAVQITRLKEVVTKNGQNPGQKMAFMDLSDGTYTLEGVPCFPENWKEYKGLLQQENTVCIHLNKLQNGYCVQKVWQI